MYQITVEQEVERGTTSGDTYTTTEVITGEFDGLATDAVVFIETMLRCFKGATVSIRLKEEAKEA